MWKDITWKFSSFDVFHSKLFIFYFIVMRQILSLVIFALLIGINATEIEDRDMGATGNGIYTTSKFFEGTLDLLQGAVIDIEYAFQDLEVMESKLSDLASHKEEFDEVVEVLTDAMDKNNLQNDFNHENI